MGQWLGFDGQVRVFPLSDSFAEMDGIPVNDDGGKQPKLTDRQQRELCRMHATGEYSISEIAEIFSVSRPTVYRTLNRRLSP